MPIAQRMTRLALTGLKGYAVLLALALLPARLAAAAPTVSTATRTGLAVRVYRHAQ